MITSSKIDTLAMATAFWPLSYPDMWNTGLPRNDFILCDETSFPRTSGLMSGQLRDLVGDRRLVMFLPTFKETRARPTTVLADELDWLGTGCDANTPSSGVREHMADRPEPTAHSRAAWLHRPVLPKFPHFEVLYRVSDALVTDYSSCLVDFLLTGSPRQLRLRS